MRTLAPQQRVMGAQRSGRTSASRAVLDLSPQELRIVVAVMACERAEGGFPNRNAIKSMAKYGSDNLPSILVELDWLEPAGKDKNVTLYRATRRAWIELGFARPAATEAA
jgi:hypothetical protein